MSQAHTDYEILNDIVVDTDDAANGFMQALMEFKRKRRYHKFIKIKPIVPVLTKGKMKKSFFYVVEQLEKLRCLVFYMGLAKFYRLASEFTVSPHGAKFYPLNHVFGDGYLQEEFLDRIETVLTWICDVCDDNEDASWMMAFITMLKENVRVLDVKIDFRSKDWYCVKSIVRINEIKGWTEDEFLMKLKKFYGGRRKKVTAEMMLVDLINGELDVTPVTTEKEKKEKKTKSKKPAEKPAEKTDSKIRLVKVSEFKE